MLFSEASLSVLISGGIYSEGIAGGIIDALVTAFLAVQAGKALSMCTVRSTELCRAVTSTLSLTFKHSDSKVCICYITYYWAAVTVGYSMSNEGTLILFSASQIGSVYMLAIFTA